MSLQPVIFGHGRAGHAIHEALLILKLRRPDLGLLNPMVHKRYEPIVRPNGSTKTLALIATPHGLHAKTITGVAKAGFDAIACEKPSVVRRNEIDLLKDISQPTAIFHVYRQMWGPQTLHTLLREGKFGDLISIEGRYWQASTADRAIHPTPTINSWKNETSLSGRSDTLLDVGTHWLDAAHFLVGEKPTHFDCDLSFANSEASHRDSHAWVSLKFPSGVRGWASISKNVHGATNHFEINLLGTRKSATWTFLNPDEILIGEGRDRHVVSRKTNDRGSRHPAFHGVGWLEGYIDITEQLACDLLGFEFRSYPTLSENLEMMKVIFDSGTLRET